MKRVREIGVMPLPYFACSQPPFLRSLTPIVRGDHRGVGGIPGGPELRTALLDPIVEIR
jgi:hypothetical protein